MVGGFRAAADDLVGGKYGGCWVHGKGVVGEGIKREKQHRGHFGGGVEGTFNQSRSS